MRTEEKREKRENKHYQIWAGFLYCISLSWKASKRYTILQFLCRIVTVFIPVAVTWNTKCIMDIFALGAEEPGRAADFGRQMVIMLVLYLLRMLSNQVSTYVNAMQSDLLLHYIECEMAKMAAGMEIEYFDNPQYYDAFESVKRDIYSVLGAVANGISVISYSVSAASCVAMLCGVALVYTVMILVAAIPVAISEYFYTKKVYWWGLGHMREERQMNYLYMTVTERKYAQEVRLYGVGGYLVEKYQRLWDEYFTNKKKVVSIRAVWNLLLSVMPEVLAVAALISVGNGVLHGIHTVGDFTLYAGLTAQLITALQCIVMSVMDLYEKKLKIDHFIEFGRLVQKKIVSGSRQPAQMPEITFEHVSFRYPGTDAYALKDVSFCLHPGEKICIVGENGAGKSTLLKLLLRFYEVQEGRILIDGIPIEEYDRESLRSRFSCFFQQADNYAFTLEENIRISGLDGTHAPDAVRQALARAGAGNLADTLPHGMDTYLTRAYHDGGTELSGGQNQKVALARMFYRDAPVLVLDEPTAALDPKAEHSLFRTIQEECADKSMLFVSHRLFNVYLADWILVMEHGNICAQGTHEKLMEECELYQKLYHYQADKYMEMG